MAGVLNDYFVSVFTVQDTYEIQEITTVQPNLIPLSDCDFTADTVTKVLDKIKVIGISEPDCIASRVLKEAKCHISKPLAIQFNKSLNAGRIPYILKIVNVTNIQKKKKISHYQLTTDQSASHPWLVS